MRRCRRISNEIELIIPGVFPIGLDDLINRDAHVQWTRVHDNTINFLGTGTACEWKVSDDSFMTMHSHENALHSICPILRNHHGRVNFWCGIHTHLDTSDFILPQLFNIASNYGYAQRLINYFLSYTRRTKYSYCMPIIWNAGGSLFWNHKRSAIRLSSQPSIEFRQMHGTLNAMEIILWNELCFEIVMKTVEKGIYFDEIIQATPRDVTKFFDEFLERPDLKRHFCSVMCDRNYEHYIHSSFNFRETMYSVDDFDGCWQV